MNMWKKLAVLLIVVIAISSLSAKPGIGDISQPNPVVEVVKNVREAVVQIRVESTVS